LKIPEGHFQLSIDLGIIIEIIDKKNRKKPEGFKQREQVQNLF